MCCPFLKLSHCFPNLSCPWFDSSTSQAQWPSKVRGNKNNRMHQTQGTFPSSIKPLWPGHTHQCVWVCVFVCVYCCPWERSQPLKLQTASISTYKVLQSTCRLIYFTINFSADPLKWVFLFSHIVLSLFLSYSFIKLPYLKEFCTQAIKYYHDCIINNAVAQFYRCYQEFYSGQKWVFYHNV